MQTTYPKPKIMGILNVTPDSFSDGGKFLKPEHAVKQGIKLIEDGADILDIGAESTRPNAKEVPFEKELELLMPVLEELLPEAKKKSVLVSIDTRKAKVMEATLEAGVDMINDVSALTFDQNSEKVIANAKPYVVLMHSQGSPDVMQNSPHYEDLVHEVGKYLKDRYQACLELGLSENKIFIDPGIGFGKTPEHNFELCKNLDKFSEIGPILIGASRKSFLGVASGEKNAQKRLPESLAIALWCYKWAKIIRVHDVLETKKSFCIMDHLLH